MRPLRWNRWSHQSDSQPTDSSVVYLLLHAKMSSHALRMQKSIIIPSNSIKLEVVFELMHDLTFSSPDDQLFPGYIIIVAFLHRRATRLTPADMQEQPQLAWWKKRCFHVVSWFVYLHRRVILQPNDSLRSRVNSLWTVPGKHVVPWHLNMATVTSNTTMQHQLVHWETSRFSFIHDILDQNKLHELNL